MDICKKLDFQPRRAVRSAHRSFWPPRPTWADGRM